MRGLFIVCALLLTVGCSGTGPPKPDPDFAAVRPAQSKPLPIADGAIYRAGYDMTLFEDRRARRVGDIIIIELVEETNASKKASTSTSKTNEIDIGSPSIYGGPVTHAGREILAASANADRSFSGEGDSTQSNSLSGSVAVTVTEVLPNGSLVVRGEKLLTLNQGSERIQLSGIVRADDIGADNTVASTKVANAQILYAGEGALADANSMGWMARFFQSPWWPF